MEMRQVSKYFPAIIVLLASTSVGAAEVSKLEKIKICATCHGVDGKATISPYPDLAGQNRDYLVYALKAYKNNERHGALANMMQQQAANLTEADINEIADYYSKMK